MPCSYCRGDHQINWCDSRNISSLYRKFKSHFIATMLRTQFESIINNDFTLAEVKVVCVVKLERRASLNKENYILILWNHFNRRMTPLPNGPDELPAWANDVDEGEGEGEGEDVAEEPDYTWHISRTPSSITNDNITNIANNVSNDDDEPIDILHFNELNNPVRFERYYQLIEVALALNFNLETAENKFDIVRELCSTEKVGLDECSICYEKVEKSKFITLNCKHEFCADCIASTLKSQQHKYRTNGAPCCAFCRDKFSTFRISSVQVNEDLDIYCRH